MHCENIYIHTYKCTSNSDHFYERMHDPAGSVINADQCNQNQNERGDPDPRVLITIIEDSLSLTMSTTSWSFCPRP